MIDHATSLESFTTFGELLKFLRLRAQLTQREIAIAVGYSEAQISRLESNKRSLDPTALKALFVPALMLEDEPEIVERLIALARQRSQFGPLMPTEVDSLAISARDIKSNL